VVGAVAFRKVALNCRPWVRSLTQTLEPLPQFCQHSRQTRRHELSDALRLRGFEDGKRSSGTTEVEQATAAGGDVLVMLPITHISTALAPLMAWS
jgi:hypothetical protein